jgi:hypothetical protein
MAWIPTVPIWCHGEDIIRRSEIELNCDSRRSTVSKLEFVSSIWKALRRTRLRWSASIKRQTTCKFSLSKEHPWQSTLLYRFTCMGLKRHFLRCTCCLDRFGLLYSFADSRSKLLQINFSSWNGLWLVTPGVRSSMHLFYRHCMADWLVAFSLIQIFFLVFHWPWFSETQDGYIPSSISLSEVFQKKTAA